MGTLQKWEYSVLVYRVYSIAEAGQDLVSNSKASLQGYGSANIVDDSEIDHKDLFPDKALEFYKYYFKAYGDQGWELVSATDTENISVGGFTNTKRLYFKRPK